MSRIKNMGIDVTDSGDIAAKLASMIEGHAQKITAQITGAFEGKQAQLNGINISLVIYEDALCLYALQQDGDWSLKFHTAVTEAVGGKLKAFGCRVKYKTLHLADYLRWLRENKKKNTSDSRAAYIVTIGGK